MTKIVESKVWNRTLVCFRSDAVDSRERADVRTAYFDNWLVGRSTGKTKSPFTFSRRLAKTAQAFSVSGTLRLAAFVLPDGLKR